MSDPAEDVIKIFKQAISKSPGGLRIKSLFGHLAPKHRNGLRQWFMKLYPNPVDHIDFIHSNQQHFKYDMETGLITVNREYNPKAEKILRREQQQQQQQQHKDAGDKKDGAVS
jgi:hypothetical protein